MTFSRKEIGKVDAPAKDELQVAEELASKLAVAIRRGTAKQVSLKREDAEQLCQLLHDSIRTAKQLKGRRT